jgi:hypothetical protein
MDFKLKLIPGLVADVDRANSLYTEQVGFLLDHDVRPSAMVRVVQLTPPGSACSIVLGAGLPGLAIRRARCAACIWWWPILLKRALV